jgi:Ribosome inactivating protein
MHWQYKQTTGKPHQFALACGTCGRHALLTCTHVYGVPRMETTSSVCHSAELKTAPLAGLRLDVEHLHVFRVAKGVVGPRELRTLARAALQAIVVISEAVRFPAVKHMVTEAMRNRAGRMGSTDILTLIKDWTTVSKQVVLADGSYPYDGIVYRTGAPEGTASSWMNLIKLIKLKP